LVDPEERKKENTKRAVKHKSANVEGHVNVSTRSKKNGWMKRTM
jgi:hypothetical protein